jgi:hypothetical protein
MLGTEPAMPTIRRQMLAWVVSAGALAACGAPADGEAGALAPGNEAVAETRLELTIVPWDVQCLRVTVNSPGQQSIQLLPVTAGTSSVTVSLGLLPAGATTFSGVERGG